MHGSPACPLLAHRRRRVCTESSTSSSSSAADAAPGELPSSTRITFSPVSGEQADALSDCLLGFGAQSVIVEEARQPGGQEQERFGAEAELWDSCTVMAHFGLDVRGLRTTWQ